MSAEQKELEQNALASRLSRSWTDFKQGKLIGYKTMAVILLVVAGLGLWWYIASERRKAGSRLWLEYDEANTTEKLQELIKKDPDAPTARTAAYNLACDLLGPQGIQLITPNARPEEHQRGLDNIEKAREEFVKLLDQFKDSPPHRAACLRALVSAEAMLATVPAKTEQPTGTGPVAPATKFKGDVDKLIGYLKQLADAAPDTPWAAQAKKWADDLTKDRNAFTRIQRELLAPGPSLPKGNDPFGPGPFAP